MEITEQDKQTIKRVLKSIVFSIRKVDVCYKIYKYYTSDFSQRIGNRIPIKMDFDSLELQIKRKLISNQLDPYFREIKTSEAKLVEDYAIKYGLKEFEDYINNLWKYHLEDFEREQQEEVQQKQNLEDEFLSKILYPKENILLKAVKCILNNSLEYKYKSDKVKAFLDIQLNTEQIFSIMNNYEDLNVNRSYIEKFKAERMALLTEGKIHSLPQEESVKKYIK